MPSAAGARGRPWGGHQWGTPSAGCHAPEERAAASDDLASCVKDAYCVLDGAIEDVAPPTIPASGNVAPDGQPTVESDNDDDDNGDTTDAVPFSSAT